MKNSILSAGIVGSLLLLAQPAFAAEAEAAESEAAESKTKSETAVVAEALLVAAKDEAAIILDSDEEAAMGDNEVRGVNPADILNRADLIVKVANLEQGETIVAVGKFDKKLGDGFGANIELPFLSYVNVGVADSTGVGDLFGRVRYVKPLSSKVIGLLSVEGVAPLASSDLLGTGKWQVNPGVGLVYMWSQRSFTATIYKHSFSIAGADDRPDISVNLVRALHSFVLDKGWYITFDAKHEWQSRGFNESWTTTEFEVGKQFNARLAGSMRIGKAYGDRSNDGTIELNVRTFF